MHSYQTLKRTEISETTILQARDVLRAFLKPTPLVRYPELCRVLDADVYIKHENLNPTRTFKIRGGLNLVSHLARANAPGVITYSTGNHGLSIATAAGEFGLPAVIVVP